MRIRDLGIRVCAIVVAAVTGWACGEAPPQDAPTAASTGEPPEVIAESRSALEFEPAPEKDDDNAEIVDAPEGPGAVADAAVIYDAGFRTNTGRFLYAVGGGGSLLKNDSTGVPQQYTRFSVIDLNGGELRSGETVHIRSTTGHYWTGQPLLPEFPNSLVVDRTAAADWEQFRIYEAWAEDGVVTGGEHVFITSHHNYYVTAEDYGAYSVVANRPTLNNPPKEWELFTFELSGFSTVSVSAPDNLAMEGPPNGGAKFRITRTGSTAAALVVPFTRTGNATYGSDYTYSIGNVTSVTIPAGQSAVAFFVNGLDDTIDERPNETAGIQLRDSASYSVGNRSATVEIRQRNVWPNVVSPANSDPWLVSHHRQISTLRPRVLVLDYTAESLPSVLSSTGKIGRLAAMLAEGSRPHGYDYAAGSQPAAQLQYQLIKGVKMKMPTAGWDWHSLFTAEATRAINMPNGAGQPMSICQLVEAGKIHEVWLYSKEGIPNLPESAEIKRRWDRSFNEAAGRDFCAGNGCISIEEAGADIVYEYGCKRSIRFVSIVSNRPVGCALESATHHWDTGYQSGIALPYLADYLRDFTDQNLTTRGFPKDSFPNGGCADRLPCLRFDLDFDDYFQYGETLRVAPTGLDAPGIAYNVGGPDDPAHNWLPNCGTLHFAPNSTRDYQTSPDRSTNYYSPYIVDSRCRHWRMFDNGAGGDIIRAFGARDIAPIAARYPWLNVQEGQGQCPTGAWAVFWLQSMPGHGTKAKEWGGQRYIRSFWPFLFY